MDLTTEASAGVEASSQRRQRTILGRPRFAGVVGAVLFAWASFMPTMMPRTTVAQALISALCMAAGYALFTLAAWPVGIRLQRRPIEITRDSRRLTWIVAGIVIADGWATLLGAALVALGGGVALVVWAPLAEAVRTLLGRLWTRARGSGLDDLMRARDDLIRSVEQVAELPDVTAPTLGGPT